MEVGGGKWIVFVSGTRFGVDLLDNILSQHFNYLSQTSSNWK